MDKLNHVLATCDAWQVSGLPGKPEVVKPLNAGLSNNSYLVQWGDHRMVVRIADAAEELGLAGQGEPACLRNAGASGLAPILIYHGLRPHCLVTEYIDGEHWRTDETVLPGNIRRLAELCKRIHALPAVDQRLDYTAVIERYRQLLARDIEAELVPAQVSAHIMDLARACRSHSSPSVVCHNDLVLSNIIDTGEQLYALDWEYTAMGEPLYELAVINHNHCYDPAATRLLLKYYFGVVDDDLMVRFQQVLTVYLYIDCLWYAVRSAKVSQFAAIARSKAEQLFERVAAGLSEG